MDTTTAEGPGRRTRLQGHMSFEEVKDAASGGEQGKGFLEVQAVYQEKTKSSLKNGGVFKCGQFWAWICLGGLLAVVFGGLGLRWKQWKPRTFRPVHAGVNLSVAYAEKGVQDQLDDVIKDLRSRGVHKIKLFNTDPLVLDKLEKHMPEAEVMVNIQDKQLSQLKNSEAELDKVVELVRGYSSIIRYIAVSNEPLASWNCNVTRPEVLLPVFESLSKKIADDPVLRDKVKAIIAFNAAILTYPEGSSKPSDAVFPDKDMGVLQYSGRDCRGVNVKQTVLKVLELCRKYSSPFVVNIYPYLTWQAIRNRYPSQKTLSLDGFVMDPQTRIDASITAPIDHSMTAGNSRSTTPGSAYYRFMLDRQYDATRTAIDKLKFTDVPLALGEIGWPSHIGPGQNDETVNLKNACLANNRVIRRLTSQLGTPLWPGKPIDYWLFEAIDESQKGVGARQEERYYGVLVAKPKTRRHKAALEQKYQLDWSGEGSWTCDGQTDEYCLVRRTGVDPTMLQDEIKRICGEIQSRQGTSCPTHPACEDDIDRADLLFNYYYHTVLRAENSPCESIRQAEKTLAFTKCALF